MRQMLRASRVVRVLAATQTHGDRTRTDSGNCLHTDSSGSERENEKLSQQRAQAVADRLQHEGINASRIRVQGRGEAQPIADNDTAEGRAANRRVEIVVLHH